MKLPRKYRSAGWIAVLSALLFISGNASAIQIDVGGFADNGSLTINFDGIEVGGNPDNLEFLFPDQLTSFTAEFSDDSAALPVIWEQTDVGAMVYNTATGILQSLSALNFDFLLELSVGASVLDPDNYVEIVNLLTGELVASSQAFPDPTPAPVPGTLLLVSLGLLLAGFRRR